MAFNRNEQAHLAKRYGWRFYGQTRPEFADTPKTGQESVWDYPRPPDIRPDSRLVEVWHGDRRLISTRQVLRLCETASPPTFYLPVDDVAFDLLTETDAVSVCEWKGRARYYALTDRPGRAVAWQYPDAGSPYQALRTCLSFYANGVRCVVDGEEVQAQTGSFYGGWVTADIVGPFKGDLGTGNW